MTPEAAFNAAELIRLRSRLAFAEKVVDYARHTRDCNTYMVGMDRCCSCGFAAALAALKEAP